MAEPINHPIHPRHPTSLPTEQDCSDDWADLDDLLEAALDGESLVSTNKTSSAAAQVAGGFPGSPEDEALVGNKLSELDALLKSEAAAADCSERASAAGRFEQAGVEASKVMEAFLRGGGQGEEGEESDTPTRRDHLGHEEERLLEMVGCRWGTETLPALDLMTPAWLHQCGQTFPVLSIYRGAS